MSEELNSSDPNQVEVQCDCGHEFQVPKSMKGGLVNCPVCQELVDVKEGFEFLYWLIIGTAFIFIGASSVVVYVSGGPVAGIVTFVIGIAILGLSMLFM